MTTTGPSDGQHQSFGAEAGKASSLVDLCLDAGRGGLVIVGPSSGTLAGIDALLGSPDVEPIEALSSRLLTWKSATAEAIEVGRIVSRAIRDGRTAVVYLDSHVGDAAPVPADLREFVCLRLSQLMVGVADVPSYVALHGEQMAQALVLDCLGDQRPVELGAIAGCCPVWQLTEETMFPGVVVSMCPAGGDGSAMVNMLKWLESRRT